MSRAERGFSALEALIAVAIVAMALVPILALRAQAARDYQRQAEMRAAATAQSNALAILREINPMAEPSGVRTLGRDDRLVWRAVPISRPVRSVGFETPDGEFDVALYRIDAEVRGRDQAPRAHFTVDLVGWRPTNAAR